MIVCPNCAWGNEQGSRFCENCGADLRSLTTSQQPESVQDPWAPRGSDAPGSPAVASSPWGAMPAVEEEPESGGRRWWLWAFVGLLALCLLVVIGFAIWATATDSGSDFMTRVAEEGTRQAGEP